MTAKEIKSDINILLYALHDAGINTPVLILLIEELCETLCREQRNI